MNLSDSRASEERFHQSSDNINTLGQEKGLKHHTFYPKLRDGGKTLVQSQS